MTAKPGAAMTHRCPGCRAVQVSDRLLACRPCWDRLSEGARRAINATARMSILSLPRRTALSAALAEWRQ